MSTPTAEREQQNAASRPGDGDGPPREVRPITRFEWERIVRALRAGNLVPPSKRLDKNGKPNKGGVSAALAKAIMLTYASHANEGGDRVFPGDAMVAVEVECDIKTVEAVRKALLRVGLLMVCNGRRAGRGIEYQLSAPSDLLEIFEFLSPDQMAEKARHIREVRRGKPKEETVGAPGGPTNTDDSVVGPTDPPQTDNAESPGGSGGPANDGSGGSAGPRLVGPPDPYTNHDHPPTTTNHYDKDVRTDVTAVAREAEPEDPSPSLVEKCEHGMTGGETACAICRHFARRPLAGTGARAA